MAAAAHLGDVYDLVPLADAEVDGLVGALVQVLEERGRDLEQVRSTEARTPSSAASRKRCSAWRCDADSRWR